MDNYLRERMYNVLDIYNESFVCEAANKKVTLNDLKNDAFLTYLRQEHKKTKKEIELIRNAKEADSEEILKKYKKYYTKYKVDNFVKKIGPVAIYPIAMY